MRNLPAFIPPDAPAPLLDLTTKDGLRRALPILAIAVRSGRHGFGDMIDLLCRSFVVHVWSGTDIRTLHNFERRATTSLTSWIDRIDAAALRYPIPLSPRRYVARTPVRF